MDLIGIIRQCDRQHRIFTLREIGEFRSSQIVLPYTTEQEDFVLVAFNEGYQVKVSIDTPAIQYNSTLKFERY